MKSEANKFNAPGAAEPQAGLVPAPVWLVIALAVIGYWAFGYLEVNGGGFNPKVYEPNYSFAVVESLQPKGEGDKVMAQGKKVYDTYCSACHQPNGLGTPGQFPPLAESDWVLTDGPSRIIRVVLNGFNGPVEVNGKQFNAAMPPWKDVITKDEEIAAVLTYIRANKAWNNNAKPVTKEQVSTVREKTKDRAEAWTADELKAVGFND